VRQRPGGRAGSAGASDSRRVGAITKAGNGHARWMLIETVQAALFPPKVTAALTLRQEGQPTAVKALAWKAQTRLHKRGWHLMARGVMKPKVIVTLAREMAGFVWAMRHLVPVPGAPPAGPLAGRACVSILGAARRCRVLASIPLPPFPVL